MLDKIPKAFILFSAFFLITEYFIGNFFSIYVSNRTNSKIKAKIRMAQRADSKSDILIFGDSAAAGAINANELQKTTGLTAFNFSLVGSAALAGNYFLFKDYLEFNGAPKYLILMNVYDVWHRDFNYAGVAEVLTTNFPKSMIEILAHIDLADGRYQDVLKKTFKHLLPSQRYKHEIKKIIETKNPIRYLQKQEEKIYRTEQELLENKGSSIFIENGGSLGDMRGHKDFIRSRKFRAASINQYYLDKLLKEAEKNGVKVFICFPPLLKKFYSEEINSQYLQSYKSFIKSIPKSYNNVVLLTDDFYVTTEDRLSNTIDHLNKKGSILFTRMIGKKILTNVD